MAKRKTRDQIQINVRMREGLRAKLEQSAKKNYESLNREIVDRLEHSFDRQDLLVEALTLAYGGQVAGRLMMIGQAMQQAGRMAAMAVDPRNSFDQWVRDPFAYRQAMEAAKIVLFELRPEGDPVTPKTTSLADASKVELIGTFVGKDLTEAIKGKGSPWLRKFAATVRELMETGEEDE